MEEKKLYEIKFEIKEVTGGPNSQVSCQVDIGEVSESANTKTQLVLGSLDITVASNLSLSLFTADKTIGTTKISLGTLFGEALQGKIDKWFKLKSEEYQNLKAKIVASLGKFEKPRVKPAVPKKTKAKATTEIKCPYLEGLASGKDSNTEALNEI